jgi:glycosyltransferase involved in cell wall biosynthesis
MKVSVVIPSYNYGHFIRDAIDSVLQQTRPADEILIVDDGSTDNTREVVESYGPRVTWRGKPNAGLSAARNSGIEWAKHPLIAFLDADDRFLPEMLERSVRAFEEFGEDLVLVAAQRRLMDASGRPIAVKNLGTPPDREWAARDIVMRTRFSPAVMVRRSAFEKVGNFDESLTASEDRDMWIRLGCVGRILHLGATLVEIRRHGTNMSKNSDRQSANMRRVLAKARTLNIDTGGDPFFWRKVEAVYQFENAMMQHRSQCQWRALKHLLRSWMAWPFFGSPGDLNELSLFRLRRLVAFLREQWQQRWGLAGEIRGLVQPATSSPSAGGDTHS